MVLGLVVMVREDYERGIHGQAGTRQDAKAEDAKHNPKGIESISPAVARTELPWVGCWKRIPPQRGCVVRGGEDAGGAQPRWVGASVGREPKVAPASQPWAAGGNPDGIPSGRGVIDLLREVCLPSVFDKRLSVPVL